MTGGSYPVVFSEPSRVISWRRTETATRAMIGAQSIQDGLATPEGEHGEFIRAEPFLSAEREFGVSQPLRGNRSGDGS